MTVRIILFSDLDGTLLDRETYSHREAAEGLQWILARKIPVIFCSNKTRAEQEVYRKQLGVNDPFIVENGGGVCVPREYFSMIPENSRPSGPYNVIDLGLEYSAVRRILDLVRRETGIPFRGFGDMDEAQVATMTQLDGEAARRAKLREYGETVVLGNPDRDLSRFREVTARHSLECVHGGRFLNVMGGSNKGSAVRILTHLFRCEYGEVRALGIGDGQNDRSMLEAVDIPFLVQQAGGVWAAMEVPNLTQIDGIGPAGWNRLPGMVEHLMENSEPEGAS
ncbi:MAG: HAD-IIB family hydrolase [Candidatus Methylomirabilales bacterium]